MTRKKRRLTIIISCVLAALLIAGVILTVVLLMRKDEERPEITVPRLPTTEETAYQADYSKLLHKVNVTESDRPFAVDGETEYKIVTLTDDGFAGRAANFMQGHLLKATGAVFDIVSDSAVTYDKATSKYIVLGSETMFAETGLTMPEDDLGQSGYYIKTVNDSVFLMPSTKYSYQQMARAFLYHTIGYVMYSQDTVFYNREDKTTLPDMDIIEKPDFDFMATPAPMPDDAAYGMGFVSTAELFLMPNGQWVHNTLDYLPQSTYAAQHPGWYSTTANQLCYTARGDEAEFQAMVETVADVIMKTSDAHPEIGSITFTQEDNSDECQCDACRALYDKYGGGAGVQILFMNAVDDIVRPQLDEKGRELTLVFFAYDSTTDPPVKKNAAGEWEPLYPEMKCHPDVGVMIAPINSIKTNFSYPFSSSYNPGVQDIIGGWQVCADVIYYWLYETNFHYYMYPFNTWEAMVENYRYCVDSGAQMMFSEGQVGQRFGTPHFTRFKEFINSQVAFDCSIEYKDLVAEYFPAYFGEASDIMYEMYEDINVWMRYLEEAYPANVAGYLYDEIGKATLWPKRKLDEYMELIEKAYKAIAPLEETNPERYKALYDHICQESLFPRYALIDLYSNYYSESDLHAMRVSFKEDATRLGCECVSEGQSFSATYTEWGV